MAIPSPINKEGVGKESEASNPIVRLMGVIKNEYLSIDIDPAAQVGELNGAFCLLTAECVVIVCPRKVGTVVAAVNVNVLVTKINDRYRL